MIDSLDPTVVLARRRGGSPGSTRTSSCSSGGTRFSPRRTRRSFCRLERMRRGAVGRGSCTSATTCMPHEVLARRPRADQDGFGQARARSRPVRRGPRHHLLAIRERGEGRGQSAAHVTISSTAGDTRSASAREELGVDGRVVLFFGLRPAVQRGLGVLLDAFAEIVRQDGRRLFVVGEIYEGRERYNARIEELGIGEPRDRMIDRYVANEEVEKYFAACDLVVLPYLSATQSAVVQVAYGFDKPVVVTSVGGLPRSVEDGVDGIRRPAERSGRRRRRDRPGSSNAGARRRWRARSAASRSVSRGRGASAR